MGTGVGQSGVSLTAYVWPSTGLIHVLKLGGGAPTVTSPASEVAHALQSDLRPESGVAAPSGVQRRGPSPRGIYAKFNNSNVFSCNLER